MRWNSVKAVSRHVNFIKRVVSLQDAYARQGQSTHSYDAAIDAYQKKSLEEIVAFWMKGI